MLDNLSLEVMHELCSYLNLYLSLYLSMALDDNAAMRQSIFEWNVEIKTYLVEDLDGKKQIWFFQLSSCVVASEIFVVEQEEESSDYSTQRRDP